MVNLSFSLITLNSVVFSFHFFRVSLNEFVVSSVDLLQRQT